MTRNALFSDDRTCRFRLTRSWGNISHLAFIMLNPSKADEKTDDPTVRKCIGFARRWGFSEITVVNLIPIVATDPYCLPPWSGLYHENAAYLRHAVDECDMSIVAWGNIAHTLSRTIAFGEHLLQFKTITEGVDLYCIGRTKNGSPLHPSRCAYTDNPEIWEWS